ncbi:MAG: hypothetical protein WCB78_19650, partial [Pseudolabrys sp.]
MAPFALRHFAGRSRLAGKASEIIYDIARRVPPSHTDPAEERERKSKASRDLPVQSSRDDRRSMPCTDDGGE